MTHPIGVPPLTQYCYQTVVANLERISSLGHLPYRLAKPILERCPSELLARLEQEFTEWQSKEYLELMDVDIWQPRCLELKGLSAYGEGQIPSSWRREYAKLSMLHQSEVSRATDRVSKFREAQESDQRKAMLTQDLPPIRRKPGVNPLLAISNPAFRKVVADTKRLSLGGPTGANSAYFMRPPRPISTMPVRNNRVTTINTASPSRSSTSSAAPSPSSRSGSTTSSLFIPKTRQTG